MYKLHGTGKEMTNLILEERWWLRINICYTYTLFIIIVIVINYLNGNEILFSCGPIFLMQVQLKYKNNCLAGIERERMKDK